MCEQTLKTYCAVVHFEVSGMILPGYFSLNMITSTVARNLGGNPAVQGFTTLYLALYLYERRVASYPGPAQLSITCSMEKRTSTNTDMDS